MNICRIFHNTVSDFWDFFWKKKLCLVAKEMWYFSCCCITLGIVLFSGNAKTDKTLPSWKFLLDIYSKIISHRLRIQLACAWRQNASKRSMGVNVKGRPSGSAVQLAECSHRGGKKLWQNPHRNPGPLAYCASTLPTELPSHLVVL